MARTTADAVKAVLLPGNDYDLERAPSLTPFIDTASIFVDRIAARAVVQELTITVTELEVIERWLAAHFYAVSDRPFAFKGEDGAQANFDGKTEKGLEATLYGQTATLLDPTDLLDEIESEAAVDDRPLAFRTAGGAWLGRRPSEQTDYQQRR
jgi:hypothetical protein